MHRLNTSLAPLWDDTFRHRSASDHSEHEHRLTTLIDNASQEPQVPIPEHLHGGGPQQTRQVNAGDIERLRLGAAIARATRALLPGGAGNQRLALASTQANSMARTLGLRRIRLNDGAHVSSVAALAVLAQSGNCREHAIVSMELAYHLGLTASICINEDDHSAVLLAPAQSGDSVVVVDSWASFPTSCLQDDSVFQTHQITQRHPPGKPKAGTFNLVALDRIRHQLEQELGPEPILQAFLSDRLAERSPESMTEMAIPHRNQLTSNLLFDDAANAMASIPVRHIQISEVDIANNTLRPLRDIQARGSLQTTMTELTNPYLSDISQIARFKALLAADRSASATVSVTESCTVNTSTPTVIDVTLSAHVQPAVRDVRLPSKNIRYHAKHVGDFFTTTAPQVIIEEVQCALDKAEALNFPNGFLWTAAKRIDFALSTLQTSREPSSSPLGHHAEHVLLQILDNNLDKLYDAEGMEVLSTLGASRASLQPGARDEALALMQRHTARINGASPSGLNGAGVP